MKETETPIRPHLNDEQIKKLVNNSFLNVMEKLICVWDGNQMYFDPEKKYDPRNKISKTEIRLRMAEFAIRHFMKKVERARIVGTSENDTLNRIPDGPFTQVDVLQGARRALLRMLGYEENEQIDSPISDKEFLRIFVTHRWSFKPASAARLSLRCPNKTGDEKPPLWGSLGKRFLENILK